MPDIASISAGLSSLKVAMDLTKALKDSSTTIKDAEVKFKIAELMTALAEAKIHLIEAQDENLSLKEDIRALEKKLAHMDDVVFRDGYYYLSEPKDGKPEGPFCTNCYSTSNQLILLTEVTGTFRRFGKFSCPSCEQRFGK